MKKSLLLKIFFKDFFSNIFFSRKNKKKIDEIFFKVHLLCQENRFKAVSVQFLQFKGKKNQGYKNVTWICPLVHSLKKYIAMYIQSSHTKMIPH